MTTQQVFQLYRLQQIDSRIMQVDAQITALDRLLADDDAIREAQAVLDEILARLTGHRRELKEAENATRAQRNKIEQSESTLYGGKVRNPKELQDLTKEIVSLKKYQSTLDDVQLEAMLAVEAVTEEETIAQAVLTRAQAAFATTSAAWRGERSTLQKERERLSAERAATGTLVDAESLAHYDALRLRRSGVAITTVKDGACTVCGGPVRPALWQQARATDGDFVHCAACGRIIYAG